MAAAAVLVIEINVGTSGSLKEKRTVVRHLLDTARQRYGVAASEVGAQHLWQRAALGFAAVAGDPGHVEEVLDAVERFVWSHPELDVLASARHWCELDG